MASTLNVSGLNVDSSGKVTFSGLSSGIDIQAAINGIMAAKQIPVDTLTQKITDNQAKISALNDLTTKLNALRSSLTNLRGAITVDNSTNAFAAKQTYASTSRTDGQTASAAGNLIGVTVSNQAATGTHTLEIRRVAAAEKIGSKTFSSQTTALGLSGSFDITGSTGTATITVSASDTLQDIRDRINNANVGTSAIGASANIVQVSSNQFILTVTNTTTGTDMSFANETGGVLGAAGLGLYDSAGGTFLNELQKQQTAEFTVDGLTDPGKFQSDLVPNASTKLSTIAPNATYPGTIGITVGASTVNVNYASTDSIQDLANNINAAITAAGAGNAVFDAGTTASVVTDGSGVRLVISDTTGDAISFTDPGGLVPGIGLDNALVVERSSNTITDLFQGVTLSLFGAEEGTTIKLEIDQDLAGVKSAIQGFVTAYNDVKSFLNTQQLTDPTTGEKSANAGVLFGSPTVSTVASQLAAAVGGVVDGADADFSVLAQIGITFADPTTVSDPTQGNTLLLDENKLDAALTANPSDVQRLLAFQFTSSDSRVSLLGFSGKTAHSASGYTLNIGNVGPAQQTGAAVLDKNAFLNDAVNSLGTTTAGSFQINGIAISYDPAVDTLQTLADNINAASVPGVTASVVADGSNFRLRINSTTNPIVVSGDTGDLVSTLALATDTYLVGSANINGAANGASDGSVTVNTTARTITATDATGADGLQVFYNGTADLSGVTINVTNGLGSELYSTLDSLLDSTTGVVQNDINSLTDQNKTANDRVTAMQDRLAIEKQTLTDKFNAMEVALAKNQQIQDSITQIFNSLYYNQNQKN